MSDLMQIRAEEARMIRAALWDAVCGTPSQGRVDRAWQLMCDALADHERIRGRAGAEGEVAR